MTQISIKHSEIKLIDNQMLIDRPDIKDELLLFKHNNKYRVISSFCPHLGGPLQVTESKFYCYFHGYEYDINSLKCLNRTLAAKVTEYLVTETNNEIIVEVED